MLVSDLYGDVALRIHDVGNVEVSTTQMISFINMAVRDARNAGWLLDLEEDESLTEAANTFSFAVPANFAYIHRLLRENTSTSTFDEEIPRNTYRLGLNGGNPTIFFFEPWYSPTAGANIKILGQKRPSLYAAGSETVDSFMEPFLLERTAYRAGIFAGFGESEYAATRRDAALLALRHSNEMLSHSPQVFRMKPNSLHVPLR